jgi:hypothetical protein
MIMCETRRAAHHLEHAHADCAHEQMAKVRGKSPPSRCMIVLRRTTDYSTAEMVTP